MSEIAVAVNSLTKTNHLLSLDMKRLTAMEAMMKDVLKATKALQSGDRERQESNNPMQMQALSLAVSDLGVHGQTIAHEQDLLASLHFPMIQARHEKIEKAHANTYEWIYRQPMPGDSKPVRFVEWLEQRNGIFWIHGKPGSGKSTLMKFICNQAQTRGHLRRWGTNHSKALDQLRGVGMEGTSKPEDENLKRLRYETELIESYHQRSGGNGDSNGETAKLVTAKYFFWNSGSNLQKSQEGLLRSLVFEALRQCPELVGHVLKTRSEHPGFAANSGDPGPFFVTAPWSFEELLLTLRDIISVRMSATFCLFIDGLDEYQEENKRTYRDLVDTLNQIAKFPNAKICASSRPWTVFLDAFKNVSEYSLKLEDLTHGDIHRFVSDKFEQHDQYQHLKEHDAGYEVLIEDVTNRAQGVFLWVYLVVRELLDGLTYNDSVQMMRQRLNKFPKDLEDFFQHMIESIPPLYRRQAARTFFITMSAPEPLLLTLHAFLDYIEDNPEFSLKKDQRLGRTELLRMHERMRRQLDGRTKGLLEVVSDSSMEFSCSQFSVDFLHRTVRDFLQSPSKVQSFMTNDEKEVSEIWVLLCRGILSAVQHALARPSTVLLLSNQQLDNFLFEFVHFAEKALRDPSNESVIIGLYKEVESTANTVPRLSACLRLPKLLCEQGIPSLLPHMNYNWSVASSPNPVEMPLLWTALIGFRGSASQQINVVAYLLENGADPNQRWLRQSNFQAYLEVVSMLKHKEEGERDRFLIVAALVAHGADLSAIVQPDFVKAFSARDAIRNTFPPELASVILEGSPSGKGAQGQPSTSGRKTQVASRRAAVRLWFRQRLGRKNA